MDKAAGVMPWIVLREPKILDVVDPVFAAIRSTIHQYLNNPAPPVFARLRAAESSRSRHLGVLCTRRTLFLFQLAEYVHSCFVLRVHRERCGNTICCNFRAAQRV